MKDRGFGLIWILVVVGLITVAGGSYFYLKNNVGSNNRGKINNPEHLEKSLNGKEDTVSNIKKPFSVKINNTGSKENPLTTGDELTISWKNCDTNIGLILSAYVEGSPHKTLSFPITTKNLNGVNIYKYKIGANIPSSMYEVWAYSTECGVGKYSNILYIKNKDELPDHKISSGWKIYNGYGFRLQYPSGYKVTESDSINNKSRTVSFAANNFSRVFGIKVLHYPKESCKSLAVNTKATRESLDGINLIKEDVSNEFSGMETYASATEYCFINLNETYKIIPRIFFKKGSSRIDVDKDFVFNKMLSTFKITSIDTTLQP